jgi:hypothetical protein
MTPADEAEFIALWNQDLAIAAIAQRLGIPRGTVSSRATALRKRGVALAKRPHGGAYPSQRAKARQGDPPTTPAPPTAPAPPAPQVPPANLAKTSWLLRTFGDAGSRKQNCHERGEGGGLENPY